MHCPFSPSLSLTITNWGHPKSSNILGHWNISGILMWLWKTNSKGGTWWQPNLWVPLSKWGRSRGISWMMASMDVLLCDFCGSCTILVCPSGQSLKTQRNKYKLAINETFNERKRRQQTRKTRSSRAKTLENNPSIWNTEKCNSFFTSYKCWKILSSLKTIHNEDFTVCVKMWPLA